MNEDRILQHTWKTPSRITIPISKLLKLDTKIEYFLLFKDFLDCQVPFAYRAGIRRQARLFDEGLQGLSMRPLGQSVYDSKSSDGACKHTFA